MDVCKLAAERCMVEEEELASYVNNICHTTGATLYYSA